jgi:hypothetical protein
VARQHPPGRAAVEVDDDQGTLGAGKTAYLTDSGAEGALVVVDLDSGSARRVLSGHPSTEPLSRSTTTKAPSAPESVR